MSVAGVIWCGGWTVLTSNFALNARFGSTAGARLVLLCPANSVGVLSKGRGGKKYCRRQRGCEEFHKISLFEFVGVRRKRRGDPCRSGQEHDGRVSCAAADRNVQQSWCLNVMNSVALVVANTRRGGRPASHVPQLDPRRRMIARTHFAAHVAIDAARLKPGF